MRHTALIGTIKIANAGTTSGSLTDTAANNGAAISAGQLKTLKMADRLLIWGPSALTGTVTVEVTPDGGTTWNQLSHNGTDVTVAAGDARDVENLAWDNLRVKSSGAEAAERSFQIMAQFDI